MCHIKQHVCFKNWKGMHEKDTNIPTRSNIIVIIGYIILKR